jgi:glycosyltransferase involved in cell wall biosynthesis
MTDAARTRLLEGYAVEEHRVITIAHGAAVPSPMSTMRSDATARPQLLTWGLLGPGKGIEHAIDAIALLGDLVPRPRYTVAGVTHPKVHLREGDTYRRSLIRRAESLGIADLVTFDDTYRDVANLTAFVASASVVILPYDSRDQVTSGVLVDAVAAGRPVIATAFPHAVELLTGGAGIVVAHGDPIALAAAIRTVLCDRGVRDDMAAHSRRLAPTLGWPAIGRAYAVLADELLSAVDAGAR